MSDHTLEWSPEPHELDPDIAVAVDTVEGRLPMVGNFMNVKAAEGHPSALDKPISADERLAAVEKIRAARKARLTPIRHDNYGAPVYAHQESIINARDCELAGFNLADVMAAYRMEAR